MAVALVLSLCITTMTGCDEKKSESNSLTSMLLLGSGGPGSIKTVHTAFNTFKLVYANDQDSITLPYVSDTDTTILTRKFSIGQTEVTNALVAEVYQWAYDSGKFSDTVGDHNGIADWTAKFGGQELINLDVGIIKIHFSGTPGGSFTVDPGFENFPAGLITWYGTVMFCNWLTEMIDGSTDNVVYTIPDTTWIDTETVEDASKTGYRLPSSGEWVFASRYLGKVPPKVEDLASAYIAQGLNGGNAALTTGYCWTPTLYASGATKDYNDAAATQAVAWYAANAGGASRHVATLAPNKLGLYDMNGNVAEWTFTIGTDPNSRWLAGGNYTEVQTVMRSSMIAYWGANACDVPVGFRIAKTR